MSSTIRLHFEVKKQICSCCGVAKPISDFYTQAYTGIPARQCIACTLIKRRAERQNSRTGKFVSKEKQRSCTEEIMYDNEDWKDALLHFRGSCAYCGRAEGRAKDARFDREHFVPISRGGKTERNNIGPACRKCNRGRGNQQLFTWFRKQPFWTAGAERKIVDWIGYEAAVKEGYNDARSE